MQDMKMTDEVACHEITEHENARHENAGHEHIRLTICIAVYYNRILIETLSFGLTRCAPEVREP